MPTVAYTGQVQGLSKIAAGTPSAFCRKVSGGSFAIEANNVVDIGIGGQRNVRRGTVGARVEFTCIGPAKADTALWFPTTALVEVAAFPDLLVEVDDGSAGLEWVLTEGQPESVTVECSDAEDAEVEYTFAARYRYADDQVIGTDVPVYTAVIGHTINDCTVQVAAADQGVLSWALSNDLGVRMFNPMDTKAADYGTQPLKYIVTRQDTGLSLVTSNVLDGDNWYGVETHTERDITIALANGTAGEDVDFECDLFVSNGFNMPFEAEDLVGFAHDFIPGSGLIYNRVKIT